MNWGKAIVAGVVGGIVVSVANFIMHGMILGATYMRYPVFTQEEANPLWFFLVAICISVAAALLFARSRPCWPQGIMGGVQYGFWVGLVYFFSTFYNPLGLEGFPYYLSWCWGGINLIGFLLLGVILGAMYKSDQAAV